MRQLLLCSMLLIAGCTSDTKPQPPPPVVVPEPVPEPTPPVVIPDPPAPEPEPFAPTPTCDGVPKPEPIVDAEGFTYVGELVVSNDWSTTNELALRPTGNPALCWDWIWQELK
jgi:hypothetical protein